MEIKVIHELGPLTLALISALANGSTAKEVVTEKAAPAPKVTKTAAPAPKVEATGEAAQEVTPQPKTAPISPAPAPKAPAPAPAPKASVPAPAPKAPVATPAPKAAAPAPAPKVETEVVFEDLDEAGKLEHIKAIVAKHTKKGKGKDVRAMLGVFGAKSSSELGAEWLDSFNNALVLYASGSTPAEIFPDHLS